MQIPLRFKIQNNSRIHGKTSNLIIDKLFWHIESESDHDNQYVPLLEINYVEIHNWARKYGQPGASPWQPEGFRLVVFFWVSVQFFWVMINVEIPNDENKNEPSKLRFEIHVGYRLWDSVRQFWTCVCGKKNHTLASRCITVLKTNTPYPSRHNTNIVTFKWRDSAIKNKKAIEHTDLHRCGLGGSAGDSFGLRRVVFSTEMDATLSGHRCGRAASAARHRSRTRVLLIFVRFLFMLFEFDLFPPSLFYRF